MTRSILTVKVAFIIGIILLLTNILQAQRQMENLNRGVIAVAQGDGKVYIGWRKTQSGYVSRLLYAGSACGMELERRQADKYMDIRQ